MYILYNIRHKIKFLCLCMSMPSTLCETAVAGLLVNRELSIIHVSFIIMSVDSLLQIISKPLERFGSEVIHPMLVANTLEYGKYIVSNQTQYSGVS